MKALSGKRMCRILKRRGWTLKRIHGSHHIFGKDDDPTTIISVPVHANQTLKKGIQHGIMKDAGLTEHDL